MALAISGNLVASEGVALDLKRPIIGYENLFSAGVVSASTEAAANPPELATNTFTNDAWKASATGTNWLRVSLASADYCSYGALASHNLGTIGATVTFQYSTDGGTTWSNLADPFVPANDAPLMITFDQTLAAEFRVLLDSTSIPYIGVVQMGALLRCPSGVNVGFAPMNMSRDNRVTNSTTEGGHFVGRSLIRRGASGNIDLSLLDPDWVRDYWDAFADHAELKPFFFAWSPVNHPAEVVYCWTDGRIRTPEYHKAKFMRVSVNLKGVAR